MLFDNVFNRCWSSSSARGSGRLHPTRETLDTTMAMRIGCVLVATLASTCSAFGPQPYGKLHTPCSACVGTDDGISRCELKLGAPPAYAKTCTKQHKQAACVAMALTCVWANPGKGKKGVWVPNDDPAVKNEFCVDCALEENYEICYEARCIPYSPPPPTPPTPPPPPHHAQCSGCQPGKIWVNSVCLDCNAQQNYKACAAAGCG